jgi:hypothetical protein
MDVVVPEYTRVTVIYGPVNAGVLTITVPVGSPLAGSWVEIDIVVPE